MDESDLYKVRNRETLKRLDSGMEIIRATKHEPIDFAGLSRSDLTLRTNKVNGSKFLPEWTLERIVAWLEEQILAQAWRFPPGIRAHIRVRLNDDIGYVDGKLVKTIAIMASGRWVHAFPDKD